MIKHYLTISARGLRKDKLNTIINSAGLASGMICCILVLMWIINELSFDNFNDNYKNIYRINKIWRGGEISNQATTSAPLSVTLTKDFPEVLNATTLLPMGTMLLKNGDNTFYENYGMLADNNFLKVFNFPLILGDKTSALQAANSILLSRDLATKYFNDSDPIGKTISMQGYALLTVRGVFENVPDNSHLQFEYLVSLESLPDTIRGDWSNSRYYTYVMLEKGSSEKFGSKIEKYLLRYTNEENSTLYLQPLRKVYLYSSGLRLNLPNTGNITYIYVFAIISTCVLIIASINFINISIAKSLKRTKEAALRNILGGDRRNIASYFLTEAFLNVIIAFTLALLISILLLPKFSELTQKSFTIKNLFNISAIPYYSGIIIITSLISGILLAYSLLKYSPLDLLKKVLVTGRRALILRKTMAIGQFFITILGLVTLFILSKQTHYLKNANLGFKKESLICIRKLPEMTNSYNAFKDELSKIPGVKNVSGSVSLPNYGYDVTTEGVSWSGKDQTMMVLMRGVGVDYDFIETMGITMQEGRSFNKHFGADSLNFVLNETAIKIMGINNPIGQSFSLWGKTGTIIGIINDYNTRSLHTSTPPMYMRLYNPMYINYIYINLKINEETATIKLIVEKWKTFYPSIPCQIINVKGLINNQYFREDRVLELIKYFSIIALLISCIGLYGLTSVITVQKAKETAIKKVFGASEKVILIQNLKVFLNWTLIAYLLALPFAIIIRDSILKIYPYKAEIPNSYYLFIGIIVFSVTLISTLYHSLKLSLTNPAINLKYE